MFSSLLLVSVLATTAAFAAPSLRKAVNTDLGPYCDGLGNGLMGSAPNFTLAAYNQTQSIASANDTGIPIVLASTGATSGASSQTFATWASWPYNSWPSYTLDNGGLTANSQSQARTIATAAQDSDAVFFLTTNMNPERQPAQIFCSVPSNEATGQHPHPYLAVHNRYDLFSLCATSTGVRHVIYNVTAGVTATTYNVDTCYPVYLNMLGDFY